MGSGGKWAQKSLLYFAALVCIWSSSSEDLEELSQRTAFNKNKTSFLFAQGWFVGRGRCLLERLCTNHPATQQGASPNWYRAGDLPSERNLYFARGVTQDLLHRWCHAIYYKWIANPLQEHTGWASCPHVQGHDKGVLIKTYVLNSKVKIRAVIFLVSSN